MARHRVFVFVSLLFFSFKCYNVRQEMCKLNTKITIAQLLRLTELGHTVKSICSPTLQYFGSHQLSQIFTHRLPSKVAFKPTVEMPSNSKDYFGFVVDTFFEPVNAVKSLVYFSVPGSILFETVRPDCARSVMMRNVLQIVAVSICFAQARDHCKTKLIGISKQASNTQQV